MPRNAVNFGNLFGRGAIHLEPDLATQFAQHADAFLHPGSMQHAAIGNQPHRQLSGQTVTLQHAAHTLDRLGKLGGTRRFAVPGKSDILQTLRICGNLARHEIAVQCVFQKSCQLPFEQIQIDRRRPATTQVVDLAINAGPVAGVIDVQIDAH